MKTLAQVLKLQETAGRCTNSFVVCKKTPYTSDDNMRKRKWIPISVP